MKRTKTYLAVDLFEDEEVPDEMIKLLVNAIEKEDVGQYIAIWLLHYDCVPFWAMYFIEQNVSQLVERGLFEELLIESYVSTEGVPDQLLMRDLFQEADKTLLRKHSDKSLHEFPLTVYRGVRGTDAAGISWTADINVAAFFATRGFHKKVPPKIYFVEINNQGYEVYLGGKTGRGEEEFIVFIDEDGLTEMHFSPEEIEEMAQVFIKEKKAREQARLARLRDGSRSNSAE